MSAELVIEFAAGSGIERDAPISPRLPIVGNGPPGTRVTFPDGWRINLPTDLVLAAERVDGRARVRLGGMAWTPDADDALTFDRVEDLWPAERLSPERARRMRLDPARVDQVSFGGVVVHPRSVAP